MNEQDQAIIQRQDDLNRQRCRDTYQKFWTASGLDKTNLDCADEQWMDNCNGEDGCTGCPFKPNPASKSQALPEEEE